MLAGDPVSPTSFGWLWFLFERRLGYRFTAIRAEALGSADLDRYNVLIVPDGSPEALAATLGGVAIDRLKDWIGRGGTLICLEDAAELPTLAEVGLSTARAVGASRNNFV